MNENLSLLSTLRIESRLCCLLSFHLDRLAAGAEALEISFDRINLEGALSAAAAGYELRSPARLRVTIARDGSWTIDKPQPLPRQDGVLFAMLSTKPVNSHDPLLPFSTTPRPIYDEAFRRAGGLGVIDVLFQNERGLITEGAKHNIFIRNRARWRTPTLAAGILPGVYRRHLLETMDNVFEEDFGRDQLHGADEVWLTNAVYGARRVTLVPENQECDC